MDQARQHMAIFNVEIILRTKDIGWNNRRIVHTVLNRVAPTDKIDSSERMNSSRRSLVENVNHPFCIGIAKVRFVRGSAMNLDCMKTISLHQSMRYHGLVDGVRCIVRKNARRETRDHLLHTGLMRDRENVIIDCHIISLEQERNLR